MLIVVQSLSGWVDNPTAAWVLKEAKAWVQRTVRHRAGTEVPVTVVWDVYSSHRSAETRQVAQELGVNLRFIPAGKTDALQQLARKIFGELKARARRMAIDEGMKQGETQVKMTDALRHFLAAWESISPENIAWQAILG